MQQTAMPALRLRSHRRSRASSGIPHAVWRALTLIAATASALMTLMAPPARAQSPVQAPDIKVGDHWTYRILDGFTNELKSEYARQVVSLSNNEIVTSNTFKGRTNSISMYFDRA